jgi:hypothetical protein
VQTRVPSPRPPRTHRGWRLSLRTLSSGIVAACLLVAGHAVAQPAPDASGPHDPGTTAVESDTLVVDRGAPNVRPLQPVGHALIAYGSARSETFRTLLRRLEQSDVVVYVDVGAGLPTGAHGLTRFVGASAGRRYVHVWITARYSYPVMVALLAHELHHAVELADAPHVRTQADVRAHYRAAGVRVAGNCYDSETAIAIGQIVRREVLSKPRDGDRRPASDPERLMARRAGDR